MRNARWWVMVAVLVAVAAFVTGLLRGLTDTAPFETSGPSLLLASHAPRI